uniref:Uncharacterized protein n=1 Tax=Populus trichocarpa TaxID=3694 RepID=A0A3N7G842_POPTR
MIHYHQCQSLSQSGRKPFMQENKGLNVIYLLQLLKYEVGKIMMLKFEVMITCSEC